MHHAWLIIAHNEFGILQQLLDALDDHSNDIYVHIDKKVSSLPELHTNKSRFTMLDRRVDVRWGSVSQIQCELALFKSAAANGPYDYYHIISGVTLPLKPLSEIDAFFFETGGKSVMTGLCQDTVYQEKLKVRRYNLFLKHYAYGPAWQRTICQFLWKSAIAIQRILGLETNRGKDFFKASNWLSLTEEAVQYILTREDVILKTYRWSFCGDEYFIPSELMASPLHDKILNSDNYLHREILRSTATSYNLSDIPELAKGGCLFARKFTNA